MKCLLALGGSLVLAAALVAQAPVVPVLDELDQAWIQNVRLASQLYQATCDALPMRDQVITLQGDTTKKIEARHPGFTMNWQTFALVPKAAPKAGP